jgi:hypothetical protein
VKEVSEMEKEKKTDPLDFYDFGPEPADDPEYDDAVLPDDIKAELAKTATA